MAPYAQIHWLIVKLAHTDIDMGSINKTTDV